MMNFLSRAAGFVVDFLFPKSRKVLEIEALSPAKLLELLPPAEKPKDGSITAIFDYKHLLVKELIWELKYRGNRAIADKLGGILFDLLVEELSERALFEKFGSPILIPTPISDKRRFERGWNQAELICEAIRRRDTRHEFKYMPRQLIKHRHTESQTRTATRQERLDNLKHSMKLLHPSTVKERCIILVDDVTTTGSTFAEARRALKEAGAKKIFCIAVAH